ncbi:MAG: hypothetical protein GY943_35380 [Chloroflexi bacterium]|nr:hypothetical protein [Chloroflexota bacterium]
MSEEIDSLKEAEKKAESSNGHEETTHTPSHSSPSYRRGSNWSSGLALIVIGVIFLVANTTNFHLDNWWALFILIPAFSNFNGAMRSYRANGRFTRSGRGSITGGLILTLIASVFLFNWDWGNIWPLFLIIFGIGALIGGWSD